MAGSAPGRLAHGAMGGLRIGLVLMAFTSLNPYFMMLIYFAGLYYLERHRPAGSRISIRGRAA